VRRSSQRDNICKIQILRTEMFWGFFFGYRDDNAVKKFANNIYEELLRSGIEVIYDDRSVRAGVMFSDADLLGVPLRIIISPRNIKENCCEIISRDKTISMKVALDLIKEKTLELIQLLDKKYID